MAQNSRAGFASVSYPSAQQQQWDQQQWNQQQWDQQQWNQQQWDQQQWDQQQVSGYAGDNVDQAVTDWSVYKVRVRCWFNCNSM